jgi:hypothetical protein
MLPVVSAVPIFIFPEEMVVPIFILPVVIAVYKLPVELVSEAEIVFAVKDVDAVMASETRKFPHISKANVGFRVFMPTKPNPRAVYNEILSADVPKDGSFSIPMVKRPLFVVVPDKSWYFMYA